MDTDLTTVDTRKAENKKEHRCQEIKASAYFQKGRKFPEPFCSTNQLLVIRDVSTCEANGQWLMFSKCIPDTR